MAATPCHPQSSSRFAKRRITVLTPARSNWMRSFWPGSAALALEHHALAEDRVPHARAAPPRAGVRRLVLARGSSRARGPRAPEPTRRRAAGVRRRADHEGRRDLREEARRRAEGARAVAPALERPGEGEPLHRARHADVAEPALLLDGALVPRRRRVGEDALLHADQVHDRELEALRRVAGHQRHAVAAALEGVEVGDERHLVEVLLERRAVVPRGGSALSKSSAPAASSRRFSTRASASGVPSRSSSRR